MDLETFPQVNLRKQKGPRRKRDPCTVDRSGGQCFIDPPVSGLLAAVDALRIHPQQYFHTVTGTVSHLCGRDPAVQPERDGTVTQVVGPGRQRRDDLLRCQSQRPGNCPGMGGVADHPACYRPEQPPICCGPELLDMLLKDPDQLRRYRHRARVIIRTVLQAPVIECFPAISPALVRLRPGPGQGEPAPTGRRQEAAVPYVVP
jgi:hypothetical protein